MDVTKNILRHVAGSMDNIWSELNVRLKLYGGNAKPRTNLTPPLPSPRLTERLELRNNPVEPVELGRWGQNVDP